jgi:DNA polymerase (family X)
MAQVNQYNAKVASRLEEIASILRAQNANPFRIGAYLRAASTIRTLQKPLDELIAEKGAAGLDELPGIGQSLSRLIFQLVKTGRLPMLDRLRGTVDPIATLNSIPGIGRKLADALHRDLGIDSLEELEAAAFDGRLEEFRFIGPKRIAGIRESLSARLGRIPRDSVMIGADQPPVSEILDVDHEYLDKVRAGKLVKIAPRRFNPQHEAWLPILHTARGRNHYTALFSNTPRAHELGRTDDWVVIYLDSDHTQRQFTVVTSERGMLSGNRIVRGREPECREYYLSAWNAAASQRECAKAA